MLLFDDAKKWIFKFSVAIYRVTELFPQEEPLKNALREHATDVVGSVNALEFASRVNLVQLLAETVSHLGAINDLIMVGCKSRLMRLINAEVLRKEGMAFEMYFRNELLLSQNDKKAEVHVALGKNAEVERVPAPLVRTLHSSKAPELQGEKPGVTINDFIGDSVVTQLSHRQEAIIEHLRAHKEAKIGDFSGIFENRFSLKTLQRDLSHLIFQRRVVREGDKRWAVYRLNSL